MTNLPLNDLKVLDLSWVVAGPFMGRVLADYGATVVRIESSKRVDTARLVAPYHNGITDKLNSACYENVNAGKLGLELDLSTERAREIIRDLVQWADVVVESFSPGVMERWKLDYKHLKSIKPELIMISSSLMGNSGPQSKFAGYGNMGAAVSGFQNITGWPDLPPLGPFGPYTDYVAPRFSLVTLLAALDYRRRTGQGCYIDIAQVEAGLHFLAPELVNYIETGDEFERIGNEDLQMAPHGVYKCKSEKEDETAWVAIAIRDDQEWKRFTKIMKEEKLAENYSTTKERFEYLDTINSLINKWTINYTNKEVEAILQEHNIPAYVVASSADAFSDPQLQFREHFVELDHPLHGKTVVEGLRFKLSRTPGEVTRHAPLYDQDRKFIFKELLGYSNFELDLLEQEGII